MEVQDLGDDPRVRQIMAMLRAISTAETPLEVMGAIMKWYWPLRPIDYMISASTRDLPGGQYRLTREINVEEVLAGRQVPVRAEPWRHRELIPVYSGGAIGEWIAGGRPKVLNGLDLRADPVMGGRLAHLRSAVVLPIHHQGEPLYFNIAFRRRDHAFTQDDVEQSLMLANLVGSGNTRLLMTEEINRLNARLTQQLEDVAEVQRSLLPKRKPDIPGLEIAVSYLTSDQAGGDYYDFFPFDDGTWGILIADVSGHGPAAATIMAMLRGILHAYADRDRSPAAVLRYANERLVEAGIEGTFVTAFLAVFDPATATVTYARAGHNPPILKDGRTGAVATLDGAGALPLGITPDYPIASESVTLRPRDTLVLYTDGITEAFNTSREMFGPERLDQALVKCSGEPECVVDSVHGALFGHTGSRTRADDQTLIALRYAGASHPEGELRITAGAARVGV